MSAPVFVDAAASAATVGEHLTVTGPQARHAVTVQRRSVGEIVDIVDGAGRRARGVLTATGSDTMTMRVEAVGHDHDPPITLIQALAKGGRDEQAIEAAVELGVTAVVPWAAHRCIVQWRGPKADKARSKWADQVMAAAKQSRRALIPAVEPLVTTAQLAAKVREAHASGVRVLILHEGATTALTALSWDSPDHPVWLIVGPEGGIADEEIAALTDAGAQAVLLGPHVLRASSAGPAALAALAACRGTWTDGSLRGGLR